MQQRQQLRTTGRPEPHRPLVSPLPLRLATISIVSENSKLKKSTTKPKKQLGRLVLILALVG